MLCTLCQAAPATAPKPLLDQVQRLTELLRDSRASGYPDATLVQFITPAGGQPLVLVVFTVEGFGGGNNHTQYLAVFRPDPDAAGAEPHFTLQDVMPIGGKGWRAITTLDAKARQDARTGVTTLTMQALAVGDNDAPNFPSRKTVVRVVLNKGRMAELPGH